MRRRTLVALATVAAAIAALAGVQLGSGGQQATAASTDCQLSAGLSSIKHVIYLQFDNTHYNSDAPNVASDLQQMPHLLDFLQKNGTLFTNDHTVLISHTAGGILSSLTGLYPDRQGQTVSNSYDFFRPNKTPTFTSSFKYWTNAVDPTNDPLPNMITDTGKNTPAPWVPFTRAGCDVGGVGTANIELENASTAATGDITRVFGNGSPEWTEAQANPQLGQTDFVGVAVHCSQASTSVCNGNPNARPDPLPDEPGTGGYNGFQALYGTKYVDPAITGGNACVNDTSGHAVTDPVGNCGFPGFDGMFASNTLGYVAQMQENGVPVTYGYISDAHDLHVPTLTTDAYASSATGPGELAHNLQLKAYDDAFAAFFQNLQEHGINKENTLFVVTVDEGDHFAGGVGRPQSGQDWLVYDHRTCTNLSTCPTNQIGEVTANLQTSTSGTTTNPGLMPLGQPAYDIHFDSAPTFYVSGQPGPTDPSVRKLERDVGNLTSLDPYVRDSAGAVQSVPLTDAMVDTVGEKALHMVNADPNRTPTFTWFANPDFFFQLSPPCSGVAECVTGGFAWNHGDIQPEIGNTWVGFVGPGIQKGGIDSSTWTDHTNLRPTILSLLGLKDDYVDDGRVLVEALTKQATPDSLAGSTVQQLGIAYEQVNASFGDFSQAVLKASTKALKGDDATYSSIESSLADLTTQRDTLAATIRSALNGAAFDGQAISQQQAQTWIAKANQLIAAAQALS
jgi:arylsulfatase A-like enzyme